MMKIFGAGVLVSLLLTVPPWPFLNRHPLPWLKKPVEAAEGQVVAAVAKEPVAKQGGGKQGGSKRRCAMAECGPLHSPLTLPVARK